MIRHTFSTLDGIGSSLERRLWSHGITSWDDFIGTGNIPFISPRRIDTMRESIRYLKEELQCLNPEPFAAFIKQREHWRLFEVFGAEPLCLDIETNGLPAGRGGVVTMVGLYDGTKYRPLIRGENLTPENLQQELSCGKILITFFGSSFDLPFLKRSFPELKIDIPHFDLCFGARRSGLRGGLKRLEGVFGLTRDEDIIGLDGYDAVLLWRQWLGGRESALDLLIRYNRDDTMNLLPLARDVYNLLKRSTGIEQYING